jgi:uncharacterized protein (TIGR00730 family)
MRKKRICVFCSAREEKLDQSFKDLAVKSGQLIGEKNYDLVYGGSAKGLMGITATAARNAGAKITGIFPRLLSPLDCNLYEREVKLGQYETLNHSMDTTVLVDNMFDRKKQMYSLSDCFLVLPGGLGTIDEFFEVLTIKNLGWHNKEIILINQDGYWEELLFLVNKAISKHFASESAAQAFKIFTKVEEAFHYLEGLILQEENDIIKIEQNFINGNESNKFSQSSEKQG